MRTAPVKSVPIPDLLNVTLYWVIQFQVKLEGAVMVKVTLLLDPVPGTLPVPLLHPVHRYWVPTDRPVVLATLSVTNVPELNHVPLAGVGLPWAETTDN